MKARALRTITGIASLLVLVAGLSRGQNWNVAGPADWLDGDNWNPTGVPGDDSAPRIENGGEAYLEGETTVRVFSLGNTSSGTGSLELRQGAVLNWTHVFAYVSQDGTGTLTLRDGATLASLNVDPIVDSGLSIARRSGSSGTVNQHGGTIFLPAARFGMASETGSSAEYNLFGGTLHVGRFAAMVRGGTGLFNQSGGTLIAEETLFINVHSIAGNATYNFSAGELRTPSIQAQHHIGGSAVWNWSGGTVRPHTAGDMAIGTVMNGTSSMIDIVLNDSGTGAVIDSSDINGVGRTITVGPYTTITGAGGLTKQGDGRLVLTQDYTYTGDTQVSGGVLEVNGSLAGGVTVGNGGTLSGSGTMHSAVTVESGGTLAIGSSTGTMKFEGILTLEGGAAWDWEFLNTGDYDQADGLVLMMSPDGILTINIRGLDGHAVSLNDEFILFTGDVADFDRERVLLLNDSDWSQGWDISDEGSLVLTAIPEPATGALLLLSLFAGLWLRRGRAGRDSCA